MTDLQIAVMAMSLMGVAFAACVKLLFDAFIVHLKNQSDLTTKAVNQAGEAVALNGRILETLTAVVGGSRDA
jgi:hypothetical protein